TPEASAREAPPKRRPRQARRLLSGSPCDGSTSWVASPPRVMAPQNLPDIVPPPRVLSRVYPCGMDERAFSRVAETYAGRLYAVAYRLLRNRAVAEDAVQRALMKEFAARASYSPRRVVAQLLY